MENYTNILKQIEKETAAIKKEEARLDELDLRAEKDAAIESKDFARYKELRAAAKENMAEYAKISKSIYLREIKKRVLTNNLRAVVFSEGYKIIKEAFKPYNGKKYGDKTREKITEAVRAAGYGFFFEGCSEKYTIQIYRIGGHYCASDNSTGFSVVYTDEKYPNGKTAYFITEDNTINLENVDVRPHNKYFEDVNAATKAIYKAIKDHQTALDKARATEEALRNILPDGIQRPDHLSTYNPTF